MTTIDLTKQLKDLYAASAAEVAVLDVPPRPFLMIDGHGDPNAGGPYAEAVAALYAASYGIRKAIKDATGDAFKVMPLEGLWWVPDMATFSLDRRDDWQWTMMISQPDQVGLELADEVVTQVTAAKHLVAGPLLRLERFGDGLAAQVLHRGPYATEAPTIQRLHAFIEEHGYQRTGKHHEVYLSDPRRSAPASMRTILRQPIAR